MPDVTVSSDVDGFMTAANQAAMRTAIGLGSVNNTSDAAKPISTATQTAINAINDVNVFPSLLDVTGVKANDLVIIEGDKAYRATGPASFVAVMADPTSHTHTTSGIVDNSVTYAKIQDVSAASRLIGRGSGSGAGDPQEISVGSGLTMTGTTLSASAAGLAEPLVMPSTVMPALAIDVTKFVNTKSISANSTMTFSNNSPTAGTRTEVRVTTDATARTLTIPSSWSYARNALITTVLIPASSTLSLIFDYVSAPSSRWEVYGDPVETSGSVGKYVLIDDSTTPTDGQVMKWVAASGKWVPANDTSGGGGGGGSTNVWVPASALIPKTTAGCGVNSSETTTNDQNYDTADFDTATDEFADFMILLPNNWSYGTITARFYWTADSGSGTVEFGLKGRAYGDDDALDQAAGTEQRVNDTLLAAGDMHITAATPAITIAGTPAANKPVQFTVLRDVSEDSLGVDARLLGVEIIYT